MQTFDYHLTRGDTWNGPTIRFRADSQSLAGATVRAHLKTKIDGIKVHEWTLEPEDLGDGEVGVTFALTDEESKRLPATTLVADVEFNLPNFGRYTPVGLRLHVSGDVTV
jgi:hypothetical protein